MSDIKEQKAPAKVIIEENVSPDIEGDESIAYENWKAYEKAVEDGKEEFPFTSGENKYDFIDIKDLAMEIVAASTQDEITGIINVCTGNPVALKDKVEAFIKEKGLPIKLKYGAFPDRPYDSKIIYGDSTKINKILMTTGK